MVVAPADAQVLRKITAKPEFRTAGTSGLILTELAQQSITKIGTRALPPPALIGTGGRVPPSAVIEDDANGSVETAGTFAPATDGIDF